MTEQTHDERTKPLPLLIPLEDCDTLVLIPRPPITPAQLHDKYEWPFKIALALTRHPNRTIRWLARTYVTATADTHVTIAGASARHDIILPELTAEAAKLVHPNATQEQLERIKHLVQNGEKPSTAIKKVLDPDTAREATKLLSDLTGYIQADPLPALLVLHTLTALHLLHNRHLTRLLIILPHEDHPQLARRTHVTITRTLNILRPHLTKHLRDHLPDEIYVAHAPPDQPENFQLPDHLKLPDQDRIRQALKRALNKRPTPEPHPHLTNRPMHYHPEDITEACSALFQTLGRQLLQENDENQPPEQAEQRLIQRVERLAKTAARALFHRPHPHLSGLTTACGTALLGPQHLIKLAKTAARKLAKQGGGRRRAWQIVRTLARKIRRKNPKARQDDIEMKEHYQQQCKLEQRTPIHDLLTDLYEPKDLTNPPPPKPHPN